MKIETCRIKQFRSINQFNCSFDAQCVVIEGNNGSGKTSLIEALYCSCYQKSFRTSDIKECIQFGQEHFSIHLHGINNDHEQWNIYTARSQEKRIIRVNDKNINTQKGIFDVYSCIFLSAHDSSIVQGYPEARRSFFDTAMVIYKPELIELFRTYRQVLKQRNAALAQDRYAYGESSINKEIQIWTEKLLTLSASITHERKIFLSILQGHCETIFSTILDQQSTIQIHIDSRINVENIYTEEKMKFSTVNNSSTTDLLGTFYQQNRTLLMREKMFKKTLFGAHLDDFKIIFNNRAAKEFASRGQQKLLIFVLKCALLKTIGNDAIFLVDDFLTDFDQNHFERALQYLFSLPTQIFITAPYSIDQVIKKNTQTSYQKISVPAW